MGVLIFRELQTRKPIAVYANFAMHYVSTHHPTAISAGYFGELQVALRRLAGEGLIVLLANGAEGDMTASYAGCKGRQPFEAVRTYGRVFADKIWTRWQTLADGDFKSQVALGVTSTTLPLGKRYPTEKLLHEPSNPALSAGGSRFL